MQRDPLLLDEMIEACQRIISLAARLDPALAAADRDLTDALLWNFTVLGEASGQISADMKAAHPELPWADPLRLRNRIVHGYWSVDMEVLAEIARDDLPSFLAGVNSVLDALGDAAD